MKIEMILKSFCDNTTFSISNSSKVISAFDSNYSWYNINRFVETNFNYSNWSRIEKIEHILNRMS